jgi:hypothetical protein
VATDTHVEVDVAVTGQSVTVRVVAEPTAQVLLPMEKVVGSGQTVVQEYMTEVEVEVVHWEVVHWGVVSWELDHWGVVSWELDHWGVVSWELVHWPVGVAQADEVWVTGQSL